MKYMLGMIFVFLYCAADAATTGNELLSRCEEMDRTGDLLDSGYCAGFIAGATNAQSRKYSEMKAAGVDRAKFGIWGPIIGGAASLNSGAFIGQEYCLRDNVTLGQIRLIFIKYARDNPSSLDQPAERILEIALAVAFPCK